MHRPDPLPILADDLRFPDTARRLIDDAYFDHSSQEWIVPRPTGDMRISMEDFSRIRRTYQTMHLQKATV